VRQRIGESDLLIFRLARERFAVELRAVEEAVEAPALRPVPECDATLRGVFALRERLLPLYSPQRVLGLRERDDHVALVLRHGPRRLALAVDDLEDVVRVPLADLRAAPPTAEGDDVVVGLLVTDGALVTVLDARALAAAVVASPSREVA
jgi:chemotaxis signal transduction protein